MLGECAGCLFERNPDCLLYTSALSIITTAYLRSEDLQTAVEENINYLNPPVQGVFNSFLTRIKHIDPDMNAALAELKSAIDLSLIHI